VAGLDARLEAVEDDLEEQQQWAAQSMEVAKV
jgi:hypothetical protein